MNRILSWFQIEPIDHGTLDSQERKNSKRIYNLLTAAAAAGYIHYLYSLVIVVLGGLLFCFWSSSRKYLVTRIENKILFLFSVIAATVALVYGNWPGFGATILFVCCFILAFVAREFVTKPMLENIFSVTIMASYFSVFVAVVEKVFFVFIGQTSHRCSGVSSNPNFYGIMAALAILLSIHKTMTVKQHRFVFYGSAAVNAVGLALCGSTSLWVIVGLFLFFYYLFTKNYKVCAVFTALAVLAILAVIAVPDLMPRLQEKPWEGSGRFNIYRSAINTLDESPVFGRGFLSYRYWRYRLGAELFPQKVSLCHNITLDCLLSHGVVGTVLIETVFVLYIKRLFQCKKAVAAKGLFSYGLPLIGATLIGVTLYGMVDTTVLWPQSGLIVLYIFAAIGVDERRVAEEQSTLQWHEEKAEKQVVLQ